MKKTTLIILIVAAILLVITLVYYKKTYGYTVRDYPQLIEEGTLRVVTDYNSIGYYVSGDTIEGFNYELIKLLQAYTPAKIEISLESSLAKSVDGLRKQQYDIMVRNIPVTSELKVYLNFTDPVAQNKLVLIQRKEEFNDSIPLIKSHLDLAKKTLHLPLNSPAILRVKNLSHEIGDTIYYVEDPIYGAEQLAFKVAAHEIDYAVCDEQTARRIAKDFPAIDANTLIGFTQFEAWAVRYDSPVLLDSLNSWIDKIKKTEQYERIYQKYYK